MRFRKFFRRSKWDRERFEEIESYVRIETDENIARGMPPAEAQDAARKKFGNITLVREEIYRMNTASFLDAMSRNLRYGLRALNRNRTFTAVALLTLAIGIGANTAVFSVVNSVLLKPLPYPKPEDLVAVRQTAPGAAGLGSISDGLRISGSMYFTYAEQNHTFQSLGVWFPNLVNVTGLAEPEQARGLLVSDGVLQTLAVPPMLGRWLSEVDQKPGNPDTMILSYGYWRRHFGEDRSVIGRKLMVNARPREIVGVMPENFRFLNLNVDMIAPLALDRRLLSLPGFAFQSIGRLKPGVTIEQANADLTRLLPVWMESWPFQGNPHLYDSWKITLGIRPLKQDVVGNVSGILWLVMGTIGIVMLIACANVANLLLVRADARQQELAIRAALGAGWGRIVRELLLESVLLGLIGGALGIGVAEEALRVLVATGPASLPRLAEISLDGRALLFTLAVSLLSGLLFGLIPALKYAGPRISLTLQGALRSAGRTASVSRERHRARNILVVAQVALALVLLVCSGLMIRTFQALRHVEPGFAHEHLQTVRIFVPVPSLVREPEQVTRLQNAVLDKFAAIPGVTSVACESSVPLEGIEPDWDGISVEGQEAREGEVPPLRRFKYVSPGVFQTLGTKMIAGRDYTWVDLYGRRPVAIVSENLARELFGSPTAALGKRIGTRVPGTGFREIVGVVQDVRENGVQEAAPETVYWPLLMANLYRPGQPQIIDVVTYAIRSERAGTEAFVSQLRQAVWSVNSNLPLAAVRTMQEVYDQSMAQTSFTLIMLAIAGGMALVLGLVGIYGVMAYSVSQRTREVGIRMALGAQPGAVRGMFVRSGLMLCGIGVAVGLVAAAALTRFMASLLFGIQPFDPLTYAATALILLTAALTASYVPARRAASVDPIEALRSE
ncbi:MAG TPA: ABC transporter permease [Bryobacteraceae bacterium]|jgi:predicted permease